MADKYILELKSTTKTFPEPKSDYVGLCKSDRGYFEGNLLATTTRGQIRAKRYNNWKAPAFHAPYGGEIRSGTELQSNAKLFPMVIHEESR